MPYGAAPGKSVNVWSMIRDRTLLLGHRGAPVELPENTMRSFRRAVALGADGVELDVQLTRDGVPVVMHDETLERTTGAPGTVAEAAWAEVGTLRAGGEPVPRLEEVVAWAAAKGTFLNVEIKASAATDAALRVIGAGGIADQVLVSSFDPDAVARAGAVLPDVRRYLLTEAWNDTVREAVRRASAQGVCLGVDAAVPEVLDELRSLSLPVVVWTVDSPARMAGLLRAGVAGLITNHPERGAAVRREIRTT